MLIIIHRKSQVEIIGLVIIVILISLALLFVLRFSLEKPVSIKKSYTHATVASNEINALMKSSTDCREDVVLTVTDLLKDCALYYPNGYKDCNGVLSCEFLDGFIDDILNETLMTWNKDFQLTASVRGDIIINKTGGVIRPGLARESETYPLQVPGRGIMFVSLDIYG